MFDYHGSFVLRLFGISASSFPLICILGLWTGEELAGFADLLLTVG